MKQRCRSNWPPPARPDEDSKTVDNNGMLRREFVAGAAGAPVALMAASSRPKIGIDLFSIRTAGWDAFQYPRLLRQAGAELVHFSEIRFLGSLEDEHVRKVRAHADKLGIELEVGMRSICPTSKAFDPAQGTAEQQLER